MLRGIDLRGSPTFYFDFVAFPCLAITLTSLFCRTLDFASWIIFGILLFTFSEYWVHRIALHQLFYHKTHAHHHDDPQGYAVFPLWFTPAIFLGFFLVMPMSVFTGVLFGYCWFIYWHHFLHHFDLTRWPRLVQRYAVWHLAHHKLDICNYGITVPIWDWLFGTYRKT